METATLQSEAIVNAADTREELYEQVFPVVARLVRQWHGSLEDAQDIFHDALVLLFEKEHAGDMAFVVSREAYLVGICKHLWRKKHARSASHVSLDGMETSIDVPEDFYPSVSTAYLLQVLEKTSARCLNLLRAFYFQALPLKRVSALLGYNSEHSVSVQKYKCLEQLREQIKNKSITYEDFLE